MPFIAFVIGGSLWFVYGLHKREKSECCHLLQPVDNTTDGRLLGEEGGHVHGGLVTADSIYWVVEPPMRYTDERLVLKPAKESDQPPSPPARIPAIYVFGPLSVRQGRQQGGGAGY